MMRHGMRCLALVALVALVPWMDFGAAHAAAAEWTAFKLVQEGNKHVGADARDRVVQIRSEKSKRGLHPTVWTIVYYDPDASLKATQVTFEDGEKKSVKRPFRLLEPISGADQELPREKLKVDSDEALRKATGLSQLENVTLTASKMWMERAEGQPVWRVELWGQHKQDAGKEVKVGEVYISTETGEAMRTNLKLNKLGQ